MRDKKPKAVVGDTWADMRAASEGRRTVLATSIDGAFAYCDVLTDNDGRPLVRPRTTRTRLRNGSLLGFRLVGRAEGE